MSYVGEGKVINKLRTQLKRQDLIIDKVDEVGVYRGFGGYPSVGTTVKDTQSSVVIWSTKVSSIS